MNETLESRLAQAVLNVGDFKADKKNQEQGYSYISADLVLERAGRALAKNGVSIIPQITQVDVAATERQGKSPRLDARVDMKFDISDGQKTIQCGWVGFGTDYSVPDKAVAKAVTSGHKYFLMKLLCISVGNPDGEHESEPEARKKAPPAPRPPVAGEMTLQQAIAKTASNGEKYGDRATETLLYVAHNPKSPPDCAEAARIILAARADGRLKEPETGALAAAAELGGQVSPA